MRHPTSGAGSGEYLLDLADESLGLVHPSLVAGEVAVTVDEATGAFTSLVTLAEGDNAVLVVATDRAGNRAELTRNVRVVTTPPDAEGPIVTIDQPAMPAGSCLASGAGTTLGGVYADASPPAGLPGEPAAIEVEVVDAAGARRLYGGVLVPETTAEVVACEEIIGQRRAVDAIRQGLRTAGSISRTRP